MHRKKTYTFAQNFVMASPQKNVNTRFVRHILVFSLFFLAHFMACSQSDPLEIRATLQMQQEPIENVLTEVTNQTGVRFSYNSQLINPKTQVTVMVENIAIQEILYSVLPSSVSFKKVGEHIVFYSISLNDTELSEFENPTDTIPAEILVENLITDNGKLTNDCHNSISEPKAAPNRPKDTLSLTNEEDMKAQIAGMMMALATVSVPAAAQDTIVPQNEVQQQVKCRPAQLTFVYPLGTGFAKSKEKCYHFSINILGGVTGYVKGFEAGGLFNINKYEVKGVQLAGILNVANSVTFQMAGIFNVAQESRVQIGGILNVTNKGCFQMGLINVRDTADGVSLGLINIVKHGGVLEAGIEASEFVHTAVTFRSGVQRLYSILSVGYNYTDHFWSFGTGLGTSFKLIKNLSLNLEITQKTIFKNISRFPANSLIQFTPVLNYSFVKHLKIYVGPSINFLFQDHTHYLGDYNPAKIRKIKVPYSLYHWSSSTVEVPHRTFDIWIGVVGGLKF